MIIQSIELGFIFSLLVIGTWLTSSVIKFDDLSIEGSFCIGGAVTAWLLTMGFSPALTLICALIIGLLAGCLTSIFHNFLKVNNLLAGILTVNILFSLSLLIASANVPLLRKRTVFNLLNLNPVFSKMILLGAVTSIALLFVRWLLTTEIGLLIQATGENKRLLIHLGKRKALFETIALSINNGLAALSGSLFVQFVGFFSAWSSVGIIVSTLASLMIGQLFTRKLNLFLLGGGIIYQLIIALAFEFNVPPELHKLISALLVIIFTILSRRKEQSC